MKTRKEMKKNAKKSLRKHYLMFLTICLIGAFLGTEFTESLSTIKSYSSEIAKDVASIPSGAVSGNRGMYDVVESMIQGENDEGRELSNELKQEEIEKSKKGNPVFGRSRGVLAQAVNAVTSGSILVTLTSAMNSVSGSQSITLAILIISGLLILFLLWMFLVNLYSVISRRMFLEGRTYEKLPVQRFLFLLRVKKWTKAAWTMFIKYVFQILWIFTIIGGIVKHYSYYMVPYIVAENPDMKALDVITLSRKMMKGHKWECFVFEISFFWWNALGVLTFQLSNIFYTNPYKTAAFCEYYVCLREKAKEIGVEHVELLNDTCLYEKPKEETLQSVYADVLQVMETSKEYKDERTGISKFLAEYFGIVLWYTPEERRYEQHQADQIRIGILKEALEGNIYPGRLFPIPESMKRKKVETLQYMRHYSVWSLVLIFFAFSLIGWLWEVSLHLVSSGQFVNRGVLHGPWLPIYGTGSILMLIFLNKLRKRPVIEFFCAVLLCGCVEYFTAYYLEMTHNGKKWWDYSGYFLNLDGRICAEGLLVFGLGGMMIIYVLAPLLDNLIKKLQLKVLIPICVALMALFIADQTYSSKHPNSGKGITDYKKISRRI